MILNKDDILKVSDIQTELVSVPEWGGDVYVRGLNGAERDKLENSLIEMRGKDRRLNMMNVRAKLASMAICDENGKRLFNDADIQALGQKSAIALQRVFEIAQRLSGIGDNDVEELTEGLEESPFGDSASASP